MSPRIEVRRVGKAMRYEFRNGRTEEHVWRLMVARDGIEECEGYAVRCDNGGWVVVNEDGETILGQGASTKTGTALSDCLFAFQKSLWVTP